MPRRKDNKYTPDQRRIMITLPESVLKDVEWLAPLEEMTRDELVREAIKRLLKPHLDIRARVLKSFAHPGKTYGPFDTVEEFIASLHKEAAKPDARKIKRNHKKALAEGKPKPLHSPKNRKQILRKLAQAVAELRQDAKEKGIDKMPMSEINAAVTAMRRDLKKNKSR